MTQVPPTMTGMTSSPPPGAPAISDPRMPGVSRPDTGGGLDVKSAIWHAVTAAEAFRLFVAAYPEAAWFLAICHRCGNDFGQPFRSEDQRDDWAAQHVTETGHVVHLSVDGFDELPHLHLSGVISRDQVGCYRYVCPAEDCSKSNGPYVSAQLAIASWRNHPPVTSREPK